MLGNCSLIQRVVKMDIDDIKLSTCEEIIIGKWQVLWNEAVETKSENGDVYLEYCSDGVVRCILYKYNFDYTFMLTALYEKLGGSDVVIPKILLDQYVPSFNIDEKSVEVRDLSSESWKEIYKNTLEIIAYHSRHPTDKQHNKQLFKLAVLLRHPPGWGYV